MGIQSSHSQGLRTVDLTWIMIPFSLYSACSALENVHTKAWSKKEKHLRTWFSVRANSLRFQRTPQGAYLLHLKMQQFVLMGVRTSFLGLGRAPAMRRNISFVINTYLGPLRIDTLPGGSSALSRAPTVPKICFMARARGHLMRPLGWRETTMLLAGQRSAGLPGKEVSGSRNSMGAAPARLCFCKASSAQGQHLFLICTQILADSLLPVPRRVSLGKSVHRLARWSKGKC